MTLQEMKKKKRILAIWKNTSRYNISKKAGQSSVYKVFFKFALSYFYFRQRCVDAFDLCLEKVKFPF